MIDQTTLIENIESYRITPAFSHNNIPLCLFTSNDYAPYCGVLIYSVIEHSKQENNYDIIVLERDVTQNNKRLILELVEKRENFSIRFLNLSLLSQQITVAVHGHFALEGSLKLYLLTDIFCAYDKFLATDSDLVFSHDIADLFATNVEGNYMAAVDDIIMKYLVANKMPSGGGGKAPKMPAGDYISEYLGMGNSDVYYNTGVVVFNLKYCREKGVFQQIIEKLCTKAYWFIEQDVLNEVCHKNTVKLNSKWNVLSGNSALEKIRNSLPEDQYLEFKNCLDDYYVMHFAGSHKPWFEPTLEYSERFFKVARNTPWYEWIMFDMGARFARRTVRKTWAQKQKEFGYSKNSQKKKVNFKTLIKIIVNKIVDFFLPKGTQRRKKIKIIYVRIRDKKLLKERKEMLRRIKQIPRSKYRKQSFYHESYKNLKELHNKYSGQRCFIVGTGPSLTISDVEKLSQEITFSLNSIHKLFPETDWRPTFYVTNDIMLNYQMAIPQETRKTELVECLKNYHFMHCFISSSKFDKEIKEMYPHKLTFLPTQDYLYQIMQPDSPRFCTDCSKRCQGFGTTIYLIFQLAVYMGFTEIYLLGTDCSYSNDKFHTYPNSAHDNFLYGEETRRKSLERALLRGFDAILKQCKKDKRLKVYNATKGGKLELFPRVDLDEILSKENL